MLKRAKLSDKSGGHMLDTTSATDNDMDAESIKTDLNREESSVDESSFYEPNEEARVVVVGKHLQRQIKKENKQMHSIKCDREEDIENFYDEDEELDDEVEEDLATAKEEANPPNPIANNGLNNTYPDLYADMLQYYQAVAAAAAAGLPANYFSKLMPSHSTKDDVSAAAQHLMQMRHQEEAAAGTQFLNETIKNFAHSINLQRGQQLNQNANINCSMPAITKGRKNARSNDLSSCSSTSSISSSSSSSSGCVVKEEPHYPNSQQANFVDINNNNIQLNKKMQLQHDKSFRHHVTMNKNNYEFGLAAYQNDDTRGHPFYQSNLEHPLNLSLHNNNNNSTSNAVVKKRKSKYDVTSSAN